MQSRKLNTAKKTRQRGLRLKIPNKALFVRFILNPWGKAFLLAFVVTVTIGLSVFTYYYAKYARITEQKLKAGPFANTSLLYAAPRPVMVGDQSQPGEIAAYLQRCGYSESSNNRLGWYRVRPDAIEINPGPDAYDPEGAVVKISAGASPRSSHCAIRASALNIFSNRS